MGTRAAARLRLRPRALRSGGERSGPELPPRLRGHPDVPAPVRWVCDIDGDAVSEFLTAPGPGAAFASTFAAFAYDGAGVTPSPGFPFNPYPATAYGGRVGAIDVDADGPADLLTGAGRDPLASSETRAYRYDGSGVTRLLAFVPFANIYGVNPAGALAGH